MEQVIIAIIGASAVIASALIGYYSAVKKNAVNEARREQEQMDNFKEIFKRFDKVDKRLDEHNHYAEKFAEVANTMTAMQKDIEYLKKGK